MTIKRDKLLTNLYDIYGSSNLNDYKYLGGGETQTKYDKASEKKGFNVHFNYLCNLIKELPELKNFNMYEVLTKSEDEFYYCVCNSKIKQRCFIIKKDSKLHFDNFITIGNCCIRRFYNGQLKRECSKCGAKHRNSKNNLCIDCRKKIITKKQFKTLDKEFNNFLLSSYIKFGKYKNCSIIKFIEDKNYFNYLLSVIDKESLNNDFNDYHNLNNAIKTFSYIKYISKILINLSEYDSNLYPSSDLNYYF